MWKSLTLADVLIGFGMHTAVGWSISCDPIIDNCTVFLNVHVTALAPACVTMSIDICGTQFSVPLQVRSL